MKVSEAKTKIVEELKSSSSFALMYELPEKVVCKCGTRCYVKILENQWFLNYSDPAWKEQTKELIRSANVYPPESLSGTSRRSTGCETGRAPGGRGWVRSCPGTRNG